MALRAVLFPHHLAVPGYSGQKSALSSSFACQPANYPAMITSSGSRNGNGIQPTQVISGIVHGRSLVAKAAEQTVSTVETLGGVTEVTQDTFWPIVEAEEDKIVVLDMYTQWCGPCKMMYPKLVGLSKQYSDVRFLKLDCNHENKLLAKELGVKVVPTFKILKNKRIVAEVKGAKFDELVQTIEKARAGSLE